MWCGISCTAGTLMFTTTWSSLSRWIKTAANASLPYLKRCAHSLWARTSRNLFAHQLSTQHPDTKAMGQRTARHRKSLKKSKARTKAALRTFMFWVWTLQLRKSSNSTHEGFNQCAWTRPTSTWCQSATSENARSACGTTKLQNSRPQAAHWTNWTISRYWNNQHKADC